MERILKLFVSLGIFAFISCSDGRTFLEEDVLKPSSSSSSDAESSSSDSDSDAASSSDAESSSSSSIEGNEPYTPIFIGNPPVIFNEIHAENTSYKDEYDNEPGWVELYNPTNDAVNLNGYILTDDVYNRAMWAFGEVTVSPQSYLVVFLSGKNQPDLNPPNKNVHASFELNKNGGKLFLMDSQKQIRDSIAYPEVKISGLSYSKKVGGDEWAFSIPTPNAENSKESYTEQVEPPKETSLMASGHYSDGLSITLPNGTEGGTIHCETNGSVPTQNSALKSGSELNITSTTILRCAQFKDGAYPSSRIMRTYIVGRLPTMPIVSIAVNPDSMFNISGYALYKSGMPGNDGCPAGQYNFYTEEEIPIHVELFEPGKAAQKNGPEWSYPAGIKIHGGCSRNHAKKSVIVSFREKYGQKNLRYPLFPEHPQLTKFKHFMLRNNGNNFGTDYIRDMLMSSLTEGLDIDYQKGRGVVVFYNGSYYGIHNLRERTNSDFFETNYNYDEDYIDLIKIDKKNEVSRGSDADYQDILSWLESISLTDDNLKILESRMDVDNFTNHFQSRIYYKDGDWPGKNIKVWRSNSPRTTWRWLLYDTDHGFGSYGEDQVNRYSSALAFATATNGPEWPNPPSSTFMLRKLLTNESYKIAFINRFSLLIATYFTTARVNERVDYLMAPIQSETTYDQTRWGHGTYTGVTAIKDFGSSRPASMQSEIGSFFNLGTAVDLTLSVSGGGKILVHNLPLLNNSVTFKVYPDVPITIEAVGTFKSWSDGNTNAKREINVSETTTLQANF